MSVNPFGVDLLPENEEGEDICVICQESINSAPTYELPECKHKYHTHCIVTWFRNSSNLGYNQGCGKCPLCGNSGINHVSNSEPRRRWYYTNPLSNTERYNFIMSQSRKSNAPTELTKLIEKLKATQESLKKTEEEQRKFKKMIKTDPMNYSECKNTLFKLKSACRRQIQICNKYKTAITWFPIVPIIIPTPIDIN